MTAQQERPNVDYGDGGVARSNEILRSLVGSGVHGIAIEGTDDRDEMGIFVEPPENVLGVAGALDQHVWRTQPEGVRSGPGDVDLTVYSLRKYLRLALAGNPTILLPLYAPDSDLIVESRLGIELRELAPKIVSRQAGHRFLGYLDQQYERMLGGGKRNRVPKRPELVEKYGWDCYLDDTEFLTRRGWLPYDQIDDDDWLGTVDACGTVEFQQPLDRVTKPYSGPIMFGRTRYTSWAVTPNHRMWVSKIDRGACGKNGDGYESSRANWEFRRADEITSASWHMRVAGTPRQIEAPISDAYLALVGAYVSEGFVAKRLKTGTASVLRFDQKDGGRLHTVMEAIGREWPLRTFRYTARPTVTTWTLANRDVANDISKSCGDGSRNKRLPEWALALSGRQSEILLWALLAGDGTPYRTGGWVYYTTSERLAGDVQALAALAGHRSNVWGPYEPAGIYQVFIADAELDREVEGFRPRSNAQHLKIVDVVDRRIVCFTVPNERLVTRREGRVAIQGNTKYASHAVRLSLQGVELMETGRLSLPMRPSDRTLCLRVKRGEVPLENVLEEITINRARLLDLVDGHLPSPLREKPDYDQVNAWAVSAHLSHWRTR